MATGNQRLVPFVILTQTLEFNGIWRPIRSHLVYVYACRHQTINHRHKAGTRPVAYERLSNTRARCSEVAIEDLDKGLLELKKRERNQHFSPNKDLGIVRDFARKK